MSDYDLLFEMAVFPLSLLIVAAMAAYFLRRSVERFMRIDFTSGAAMEPGESFVDGKTYERRRLSLRRDQDPIAMLYLRFS